MILRRRHQAELFDPDYDLETKVSDILFQWAGVEDEDPDSRGDYFDARKLSFLEAITGNQHFDDTHTPDASQAVYLEQAWEKAFASLSAHLLGQAAVGALIGEPDYSVISDNLSVGGLGDTDFQFADLSTSSTMTGSANNDVYIFKAGDAEAYSGTITVSETAGDGFNTILITGGISPDDVRMWTSSAGNLMIKYDDDDTISVGGELQ